ncbi:MAG: hypothetical protein CXR31_08825 [Geobacter sp.]|nr:MAG: hypothetical protein CXR31_08825 [Geobacter sp.]
MSSKKTEVIRNIFNDLWDEKAKKLTRDVVTKDDIADAIRGINAKASSPKAKLSVSNPANFFKDFVRSSISANKNWPDDVFKRGYTAEQKTGKGDVFRFISLVTGQKTPFVESVASYPKLGAAEEFKVQSLSLPVVTRLMGRRDEAWLLQIAVKLRLIESHLAFCSEHDFEFVDHLQNGLKLRNAEIDSLFYGKTKHGDIMIITVEAKNKKDDILETQILSQVKSVQGMANIKNNKKEFLDGSKTLQVLPMAMKIVGDSKIYMAEYQPILFDGPEPLLKDLVLRKESFGTLSPEVPGVC